MQLLVSYKKNKKHLFNFSCSIGLIVGFQCTAGILIQFYYIIITDYSMISGLSSLSLSPSLPTYRFSLPSFGRAIIVLNIYYCSCSLLFQYNPVSIKPTFVFGWIISLLSNSNLSWILHLTLVYSFTLTLLSLFLADFWVIIVGRETWGIFPTLIHVLILYSKRTATLLSFFQRLGTFLLCESSVLLFLYWIMLNSDEVLCDFLYWVFFSDGVY